MTNVVNKKARANTIDRVNKAMYGRVEGDMTGLKAGKEE
jgi:hypothetical protein